MLIVELIAIAELFRHLYPSSLLNEELSHLKQLMQVFEGQYEPSEQMNTVNELRSQNLLMLLLSLVYIGRGKDAYSSAKNKELDISDDPTVVCFSLLIADSSRRNV